MCAGDLPAVACRLLAFTKDETKNKLCLQLCYPQTAFCVAASPKNDTLFNTNGTCSTVTPLCIFKWPQFCVLCGKLLSRSVERVAEESALKLALSGP